MYKVSLILLTLKHVDFINSEGMEGHVIGGTYTDMSAYPHTVFLDINSHIAFVCGGSILTHTIVLSAAHCLDDYLGRVKDSVIVKYGSNSVKHASQVRMKYYMMHDDFNEHTMFGDLALLLCESHIQLGRNVKRVAIMMRAPREKSGYVSGWGLIDDHDGIPKGIKHTYQTLQSDATCLKHLHLPKGTFCAGPIHGEGHPANGDSGGALVIQHYIQIGIVSFKEDHSSLVAYTNVSYYFNWIKLNAARTFCAKP